MAKLERAEKLRKRKSIEAMIAQRSKEYDASRRYVWQALVLTGKGQTHEIRDTVKRLFKVEWSPKTVRRRLIELVREKKATVDNNDVYWLSETAMADVRRSPELYGEMALSLLTTIRYKPKDRILSHLVRLFGCLCIGICLEACRPVGGRSFNVGEKDTYILSWIRNAMPLDSMFQVFLACFDRDDKKYDGSEPVYELDERAIKNIMNKFMKSYPKEYLKLKEARSDFAGRPKEASLRKKMWYYDYDIDDGEFISAPG